MNKVQTLLFPFEEFLTEMSLKKYMLLTFATLWTVLLIIALIATLIHQVKYQESTEQIHLERQLSELTENLNFANAEVTTLELSIKDAKSTHEGIIARQQLEIAKGKETIKGLREFYFYIIRPEALYYADVLDD